LEKINVLIIDGHDRRALASVRSLGSSSEYNIFIGSNKRLNSSRYSKYCERFFLYRNPDDNIKGFIQDVNDILISQKVHVLIPMDDRMASYVAENKYSFSQDTKILIPDWEIFKIARDKSLTLETADKIGIPIPRSFQIEEALKLKEASFPLIIKPTVSSASIGMSVVKSQSDLKNVYNDINKRFPNPLIQEMIPQGGHYQANVIFDKSSNLVCCSVKNKIREFPLSGGPSTFFRTVDYPIIEQYAEKLLKAINWIGPAEVEFMVNPKTNEPILMEINPRMSATIILSIKAGMNFPEYIVNCALDKNKISGLRNKKFNLFCQWLIPGDLSNFLFNKNRFSDKYGYFYKKGIKCYHMTFDKNDIKPFLVNFYIVAKSIINPSKIKRFIFRK